MAANRLAFNLTRAFDACADADGDITEAHFLQLCQARFLGVTGGTGAQADALVLCHEPTRSHMRGLPDYSLPTLQACMDANLAAARLTNPAVRFVGIAVNTSQMAESSVEAYLRRLESEFELPTVDPFAEGVAPLVDR